MRFDTGEYLDFISAVVVAVILLFIIRHYIRLVRRLGYASATVTGFLALLLTVCTLFFGRLPFWIATHHADTIAAC